MSTAASTTNAMMNAIARLSSVPNTSANPLTVVPPPFSATFTMSDAISESGTTTIATMTMSLAACTL